MRAATLTKLAEVCREILLDSDPWQKELDVAAAIRMLAEAVPHTDTENAAENCAGEIELQVQANAERHAEDGEFAHEREWNRHEGYRTAIRMSDERARKQARQWNRFRAPGTPPRSEEIDALALDAPVLLAAQVN